MKNKMIVVTNLGSFKAYRVEQDGRSTPRLEPVPTEDAPDEHGKRSNTLTVMERKVSGGVGGSGINATGSDGEQHNMELEKRRRAIKKIADNLHQLLNREPSLTCLLAAPKEILGQILEAVHPTLRKRIDQATPLDLTWSSKADLIEHFCPRPVQPS